MKRSAFSVTLVILGTFLMYLPATATTITSVSSGSTQGSTAEIVSLSNQFMNLGFTFFAPAKILTAPSSVEISSQDASAFVGAEQSAPQIVPIEPAPLASPVVPSTPVVAVADAGDPQPEPILPNVVPAVPGVIAGSLDDLAALASSQPVTEPEALVQAVGDADAAAALAPVPAPVPEPATALLLGSALCCLGLYFRRRI